MPVNRCISIFEATFELVDLSDQVQKLLGNVKCVSLKHKPIIHPFTSQTTIYPDAVVALTQALFSNSSSPSTILSNDKSQQSPLSPLLLRIGKCDLLQRRFAGLILAQVHAHQAFPESSVVWNKEVEQLVDDNVIP